MSMDTHWKAIALEAMSAGGGGRRKGATQSVGASSGSGWPLLAAAYTAIISSSILSNSASSISKSSSMVARSWPRAAVLCAIERRRQFALRGLYAARRSVFSRAAAHS